MIEYVGQAKQDLWMDKNIFKGKRKLKFLDIGSYDGKSINNTYVFEKYYDWTGICIEANPSIYSELKKNRNCIIVNKALSDKVETRKYVKITGYGKMTGTFLDDMKPGHKKLMDMNLKNHPESVKEIIEVECVPLMDILDEHKLYDFDFMSIDIEGGEETILKSVDWNKVNIGIILYENNYHGNKIEKYMNDFGYYQHPQKLGADNILIKKGYL